MSVLKKSAGIYSLNIKGKEISMFLADNGSVEMYEDDNPGETGFFFSSMKDFTIFCNYLCDIVESEDKNAKI